MEEFDLKELYDYFISKIKIFIIIVVLTLIIGTVYSLFIQVPMYNSYTSILLTKEYDGTTINSSDIQLNKNLVDSYREIIKSKKVLNKVSSNLGLNYTYEQLKKLVTIESVNDTDIIKITVINEDNVLARDIAAEIARVFKSEIIKLYNLQNIGTVDEAEISENPYNINIVKEVIISTMIGIVLSLVIIFVLYYFDNTVKTAEEIERKTKLTVIGNIPVMRGGSNE